jgi:1-acyl-sn-glycerol-3-phosphate acyltransferase
VKRFEFARRVPGRSVTRILWWDVSRWVFTTALRLVYGLRVRGLEHIPERGPVLFVSNHQSYFDPVINGAIVKDRQYTAIARESLFRFKPFAWLIRSYGALAVAGEASDTAAIKIALGELAAGRCILIYPEGTRSPDGALREFQRGVLLLQRRAKVDVVPIGIDGACDSWPRASKRPLWTGRIAAEAGPVIPAAQLAAMSADEAMELLSSECDRLRHSVRQSMRERTGGRWPLPGPGDQLRVPPPPRNAAPVATPAPAAAPAPPVPTHADLT